MIDLPTHVAYSDESYSTASRYRSIAVVSLEHKHAQEVSQGFARVIKDSGLKEFKWSRLRQARERFAALSIIDRTVELALERYLRIDVLIWDTQDSRHKIRGRDDIANLQRMYYHLFKNVLKLRWPDGSTWYLFPDENSALDWTEVNEFLSVAGIGDLSQEGLLSKGFGYELIRDFRIEGIDEVVSADTPICQIADLFAGLGAYTHAAFKKYESWLCSQSKQISLDLGMDNTSEHLSRSDRERCPVIHHLNDICKRHKLRVGLKSSCGFRTHTPSYPVNFWTYEPQHPDDKAPTREESL